MTAGEYCNRQVVIAEPEMSVTEAAVLMRQHHVGDLVVVEKHGGKTIPAGIVTDRDLVIEIIAQKVDPQSLAVKDIMSTGVVTVKEDETLLDVLEIMQKKSVRRVVVVDDDGELQGLLTADDAIELIAEAMNNLTKLIGREISRETKQRP